MHHSHYSKMVRLKHRYILFDILQPPSSHPSTSTQREKFGTFSESPKAALLSLHATSPSSITARAIALVLKHVIEDHFGELAAGTVALLIIVKYFSNKTSTGIIRCNRKNSHQVVAAMALVTKMDNCNVVMRCVHMSGTIRKCEQFSIRNNRKLMIEMGQDESMKRGLDEFISMFGEEKEEDDEA